MHGMSYLSNIISDLESSTESFSAVCKRHGIHSGKAHAQVGRVRPDLLGPRSERLGFSTLRKPGSVPDNVKEQAIAEVLAGRLVKDVAVEYGIPAPTLYKHAAAERAKRPPTTTATTAAPSSTTPNSDPIKAHLADAIQALHAAVIRAQEAGLSPTVIIKVVSESLQT